MPSGTLLTWLASSRRTKEIVTPASPRAHAIIVERLPRISKIRQFRTLASRFAAHVCPNSRHVGRRIFARMACEIIHHFALHFLHLGAMGARHVRKQL